MSERTYDTNAMSAKQRDGNMGISPLTPQSFVCPKQYIQGSGILARLPGYTQKYGAQPFVIITNSLFEALSSKLPDIYGDASSLVIKRFRGQCCRSEVDRLSTAASSSQADIVIGIGGGKLMDTAKMVSHELGLPLLIMPTSASCDAATSAMSVLYEENGAFLNSVILPKRADLILVDTDIIMSSPLRLLVAGMGDALASYFEARAGKAANALNYVDSGYYPSQLAWLIARATYDLLLAHGRQAVHSFRAGILDEHLNTIIETNILLSGLAFENTCCAAAHGLHAALAQISAEDRSLHGEKVAFGLLCQLKLEGQGEQEFQEVVSFCHDVGLPVTLSQLGIPSDRATARQIAGIALATASQLNNEPIIVTQDNLSEAILSADSSGRTYLRQQGSAADNVRNPA